MLCAVDRAEAGAGRIFNVADERSLTLAQIAEVIADELDHRFEILSLPPELAVPARPLVMHHATNHRVVNTSDLRTVLGYRDVVTPEEGLRRTARWLAENQPSDRAATLLQDPFDYAAEDELIARWRRTVASFEMPTFATEPGFGAAYYGRGTNPATGGNRVEPPS